MPEAGPVVSEGGGTVGNDEVGDMKKKWQKSMQEHKEPSWQEKMATDLVGGFTQSFMQKKPKEKDPNSDSNSDAASTTSSSKDDWKWAFLTAAKSNNHSSKLV